MATKKDGEQLSMIDSFREFKETKNIDRTTLFSVVDVCLRNVISKIFCC